MRDFSKVQTDELLRSYRFHVNDRGTMTMEEECRRMSLVDQIGAELQRRNINPDDPRSAGVQRVRNCEIGSWG